MLNCFRNKGLEELFHTGTTRHISNRFHANCVLIVDVLNVAKGPGDLEGVKGFHPLKGDRTGYYAMHVNGNWRITFRFDGIDTTDIDLEDYH
jgi:proteic killer suppression protein